MGPLNILEPVTFKLPLVVKKVVTTNEFKAASEPDIIIFFQFGIYFFIMVGYIGYYIHFPLGPIIW
jgi:hypothetical protein